MFVHCLCKYVSRVVIGFRLNVHTHELTHNNVIYRVNETFKMLVSRSVLRRIALLIDSCAKVSASEAATRYINWKRINLRCSLCYRLSSQLRTSIRALREKSPRFFFKILLSFTVDKGLVLRKFKVDSRALCAKREMMNRKTKLDNRESSNDCD